MWSCFSWSCSLDVVCVCNAYLFLCSCNFIRFMPASGVWKAGRTIAHTHTNAHSQNSHKKVDEKHPFVQRRAVSCCFISSDNWGKLVFYSCANQQLSQLFTRRNDGEKFLWKKTTTGFDANKKMYFRRLASSCFLHSHFSFVSTFFSLFRFHLSAA